MQPSYSWEQKAACIGKTRIFYSLSYKKQDEAKAICKEKCPVRRQCLAAALLRKEDYGVWGGCTPSELKLVGRISTTIADFQSRQINAMNGTEPKQVTPTLRITIPARLKISS